MNRTIGSILLQLGGLVLVAVIGIALFRVNQIIRPELTPRSSKPPEIASNMIKVSAASTAVAPRADLDTNGASVKPDTTGGLIVSLPKPATPPVPATIVAANSDTNATLDAKFVSIRADLPPLMVGSSFTPDDGKPVYICSVATFGSYLTAMQMQTSGRDIAHGFHLAIYPWELNDTYNLTEEQGNALIVEGKLDCDFNTVDGVAQFNQGVITAIIDESAGGDGMWARNVNSIYDLKDKRIAYVKNSSPDFFLRYALSIAQIDPKAVQLLPVDTVEDALNLFKTGQADVVSAWEPQLSEAGAAGGRPLITSEQLRIIVDVIVTSRQSIANKPQLVQAFHDAWFETLKAQSEDVNLAAKQIARWGLNDWTGISTSNTEQDLRGAMALIAQASLSDNARLMQNTAPLTNLLSTSRQIWKSAGAAVTEVGALESLIDPQFVQHSAAQPQLISNVAVLNKNFSLAAASTTPRTATLSVTALPSTLAATPLTQTTTADGTLAPLTDLSALTVLPCRRFAFLPDSAELTADSRRVLDLCVVPALQQRAGAYLLIKGSAAWPGPQGTYSEAQIRSISQARAQAVANYLISQKIDPARLKAEAVLPPQEHWETIDPTIQLGDRYVEMTLLTTGR